MTRRRCIARHWHFHQTLVAALALVIGSLTSFANAAEPGGRSADDRAAEIRATYLSGCDTSLFVAGDAIITQPWSHVSDDAFVGLIGEMRAADATVVNLEMLIHEYRGYAQAHSGGTHFAARPEIAFELAWAGVDMVAHANNHTFDYGSIGVLETLDNVSKAGLALSGSGADLQRARAPAYFQNGNSKVALVSTASSFVSYGQASRSRSDMRGRPGLNPLTTVDGLEITIPKSMAALLRKTVRLVGFEGSRFTRQRFRLMGMRFRIGDEYDVVTGKRVARKDLEANLSAVRTARENADIVVVSVHAHLQGDWLTDFAHKTIDAGADIFFAHGPHHVLGVELYKGKPIFYGMGDFVYQTQHIERLPVEFYDRYGFGDDISPEEAMTLREIQIPDWPLFRPEVFEGFGASLCFREGVLANVRLIPVDLGHGEPLETRGRPRLADSQLGRKIIDEVGEKSKDYQTVIQYDDTDNVGRIRLD